MEGKESSKPRRPLPTPGVPGQRPNTPVSGALNSSGVRPSSFYGTPKTSTFPQRAHTIGSSHTTYIPPAEDPPTYSTGYREPELVVDEPLHTATSVARQVQWDQKDDRATGGWLEEKEWKNDWDATTEAADAWGQSTTTTNGWEEFYTPSKTWVDVDGRDDNEEKSWWDPSVRDKTSRPGPGMLPPILAEELHDSDHSLFSVNVTPPDIRPNPPPQLTTAASANTDAPPDPPSTPQRAAWSSQQTSSPPSNAPVSSSSSSPPPPPPSDQEARTSVPHPNAYYCPKENGWVILSWKSSSVAPKLAKSYNALDHPLPPQQRRKTGTLCTKSEAPNKTHHFHKYEKAIDSHKLTPPFKQEEWEVIDSVKQRRRGATVMSDIDVQSLNAEDVEMLDDGDVPTDQEGKLLDLYICCQCPFYCVASGVIPGVIPRRVFEEFVRDRKENPPPGKTGVQAVVAGIETLIMVLENRLWKGENRLLKVARPSFQAKIGWNSNVKRIFEVLGFNEENLENEAALRPPPTDASTPGGTQSKRKLLRTWVEISAWLVAYRRQYQTQVPASKTRLWVQISSAREDYQLAIGAHHDQIARGELQGIVLQAMLPLREDWETLGLMPMSFSPELLGFAYHSQCRCDPGGTAKYFSALVNIVEVLQNCTACPASLQELVATERSRDRFTLNEVIKAAAALGFGPSGVLKVEYEAEVEDNFIELAWRACVKQSWKDPDHGGEILREANEALRILAESRGSKALRDIWENEKGRLMSPDKAYDTLEVPKDVPDDMLITVFTMRVEEATTSQMDKMREAMQVIAEVRESERLRQFIGTGRDPGEIVVPVNPELPRGLNQLGNTCYLNSLLQYFYTIKDLREAILPMLKADPSSVDEDKFSEEDLKRFRVGGRLVTRKEVIRSRKFINQLADLFFNLEYCEAAAVTPTIELAKLALVTSKDEEEDEADGDKGGTVSSNDTDATLVDDPLTITTSTSNIAVPASSESPRSPSHAQSSSSILGKRNRDGELQASSSAMDLDTEIGPPSSPNPIDSPSRMSDSPPPLISPGSPMIESQPEASGSGSGKKAPPLPPRKNPRTDSVMMFGKQHDVAECMDNCMFQIETALLKFDGQQAEGSDKTSVVKRLFYGRLRQRLTGNSVSRSSVHEKEDLFSHLPVNVTYDGVDIYDGLSGYFDDVVEFNGEKRRMEVSLVDLPPVLQIQLQRVQFNRETLQPFKNQSYVKFGETIYMDRFMDSADPLKKSRTKAIQRELADHRERVRLLVEGKDGPFHNTISHTHAFLTSVAHTNLPISQELLGSLSDEQTHLQSEIDALRAHIDTLKAELEALWADSQEMAYELTSVFIHRGSSPSWGHYFFYARNLPGKPDEWFKYNDSDVTVVSKEEVLADTTGSTANPYLLVFSRKGAEVVDTVKRFAVSDDQMLYD